VFGSTHPETIPVVEDTEAEVVALQVEPTTHPFKELVAAGAFAPLVTFPNN
jgi:hypothetical protein